MQEKQKDCPRCNANFGCGSGGTMGCWCCDLPQVMPMDALADIESKCLCISCLKASVQARIEMMIRMKETDADFRKKVIETKKGDLLIEDIDYYYNSDGYWVFTAWYHLKRGYCCSNGCKHCPYGFKNEKTT